MSVTKNQIDELKALDPTVTVGTALATCTGYRVVGYDGTTAWFEGPERYAPPGGGPYLPPYGDKHSRIDFTVEALPKCDAVRRIAVFPVDAVRSAHEYTWFQSDVYGGY